MARRFLCALLRVSEPDSYEYDGYTVLAFLCALLRVSEPDAERVRV